jgi:thiol-disulfide isomerase/thioredoxin
MKSISAISVSSVLLIIAGLLLTACTKSTSPPEQADPASPELLQQITLEKIDGEGLKKVVQQHHGQVVLIDFWATWCGPCKELFPHTVELHNRFFPADLAVITVSLDKLEQREAVLEFLRQRRANTENYQSSIESDSEAFSVFAIEEGIPQVRIFDRGGKLFRTINGNQPAEIEHAVDDAMARCKTE